MNEEETREYDKNLKRIKELLKNIQKDNLDIYELLKLVMKNRAVTFLIAMILNGEKEE